MKGDTFELRSSNLPGSIKDQEDRHNVERRENTNFLVAILQPIAAAECCLNRNSLDSRESSLSS